MADSRIIEFPRGWISASKLEQILRAGQSPHESNEVRFEFRNGSKIMIDAAVRLLSLLNQVDHCTRRAVVSFEEGLAGVMGYLDRMGFFDHLADGVHVDPERPNYSGAEIYGGANPGLVEIARIPRHVRDQQLPNRLATALTDACSGRPDGKRLGQAAWTIFAELIDNIFSHSQTQLDGYAALQVYPRGGVIKVAVSDSGLGIMETLRPVLNRQSASLVKLSDIELLVEVFRQGLSRHGRDRGCGLRGSATKAMKYHGELDVRLPRLRVLLVPGEGEYKPNKAYCYDGLPLIWGTHICFTFRLDNWGSIWFNEGDERDHVVTPV